MNPDILEFLKNFRGKIYIVGGFIRDMLIVRSFKIPENLYEIILHTKPGDIDIVVDGNFDDFLKEFRTYFRNRIVPLKEELGQFRIILGQDTWLDVAPIKGENIIEDLKMRDFTINSMAIYIHEPKVLIDPTGGLEDLKNRLIRSFSKTNILNDPLRILRGFRFLSRLCFDIEEETLGWFREIKNGLQRVAPERIHFEIMEIFSGKCLPQTLDLMVETEVLFQVFPELLPLRDTWQVYYGRQNLLEHTLLAVKKLHYLVENLSDIEFLAPYRKYFEDYISDRKWRAIMMLGALFHDVAKPATLTKDEEGKTHFYGHDKEGCRIFEKIAERLKFSNFEKETICQFIRSHMHPHLIARESDRTKRAVNRYLRKLGDLAFPLILFAFADAMASPPQEGGLEGHKELLRMMVEIINEKSKKKERIITGNDLIALGLTPSPIFKEILDDVDDLFAEGIIKTKEEALKYVKEKYLSGVNRR